MRNFPALFFILAVALMFGGALYFYSDATFSIPKFSTPSTKKSPGENSPVPFVVLEEGVRAPSVTTRVNYAITNVDELASLWELVYGNNGPNIPTIDFEKYMVLGIFDGTHTTGGYSIQVQSIKDSGGKRVVMVTRTTPGVGCSPANTATAPFQIVRIPNTFLALDHEDATTPDASCTQ